MPQSRMNGEVCTFLDTQEVVLIWVHFLTHKTWFFYKWEVVLIWAQIHLLESFLCTKEMKVIMSFIGSSWPAERPKTGTPAACVKSQVNLDMMLYLFDCRISFLCKHQYLFMSFEDMTTNIRRHHYTVFKNRVWRHVYTNVPTKGNFYYNIPQNFAKLKLL